MGFLQRRRRESQEEKNKQQDIRDLADKARAGGEDVKETLLGIRFTGGSGRISEENLENLKRIVTSLAEMLDKNGVLAVDTSVIDDCLKQMAGMLQDAINNGYEKSIKEICENLKMGITEMRKPVSATDSLEREWEMEQRNASLTQILGILKYTIQIEKTELEIAELEAQIEHGRERYSEAYKAFHEIADERRDVVNALDRMAIEKPPKDIIGDVMILQARKQNVVTIFNSINQAKTIMGVKENRRTSLLKAVETMKNEIRLSKNRLNPSLLALQEQMQKNIEEALVQEKKENTRLREIVNEFDASLEAYFADPEIVNEMIETDMKFRKLLESERLAEEGRRLAREEKQQQANSRIMQTT